MPQIKENFYENILFKFETYACDCVEDIEHIAPGEEPVSKFKLQSLPNKKVLFGYAAKKGLVRIANNGTIEENNILGTLISLVDKPKKALISFLQNNGFLFPVSSIMYEVVDESCLYGIINRLKLTVELMSATNEIRKDYSKICELTLSLLFSDPIEFKTESMMNKYQGCHHSYIDLIMNPPTQLSSERKQEEFNGDVYTVNDSIYGTYELKINEYNDIIGGYVSIPGYSNGFYQNLASLYLNYSMDDISKDITDFLFHYLHDMVAMNNMNFSEEMKKVSIKIAKYVVGEEINANLNGIHPVYDSETMTPSWKVDSLLCAAYFSIFYLKPDLELYRPCDNPRCGKYFLVKTTSTRNRFCSQECCNRVTQDRYRKRKREREEN